MSQQRSSVLRASALCRRLVAGLIAGSVVAIPSIAGSTSIAFAGVVPALQLPWPAGTAWNISGFSYGCFDHMGNDYYAIDFGLTGGNQVNAVADGTAYTATGDNGGYGYIVWINHGGGLVSLYAHLQSFAIPPGGTLVHAGQLIAYSDNSGTGSRGDHLHFALHYGATTWSDGLAYQPEPMSRLLGFGAYGTCGQSPSPNFTSQPNSWSSPASGPMASSTVYSSTSGQRDLFAVNTSGCLMYTSASPSAGPPWPAPTSLGCGFGGGSPPVSTRSEYSGELDVYVIDSNGALWHKRWTSSGGWGIFENLSAGTCSTFAGAPAATASTFNGILDVYTITSRGVLCHNWAYNAGSFVGWDMPPNGPTNFTGSPAATNDPANGNANAYGERDVYAITASGSLWHNWAHPGPPPGGPWVGWDQVMGAVLTGSPTATASAWNGNRDVYAMTSGGTSPSGRLYHNWAVTPGGWAGWDSVSNTTNNTGIPAYFSGFSAATASTFNGNRDVYVVTPTTPNGRLMHNFAGPSGGWAGWDLVDSISTFFGSPTASAYALYGNRDVYVISAGGQMQHYSAPPVGAWSAMDPIDSGYP
jgi:hypothetical protein